MSRMFLTLLVTIAASLTGLRVVGTDNKGENAEYNNTRATSERVSAGNGLIAFPGRDPQGRQQLYTITIDGTNRRQLTFENNNSMPSWSPDGARLVYVSRTPAPNLTIMDEDGGNKRTLVTGDAPDWGPNGQIAYTIGQPAEIWVVDAAGGTPRQVTSGGGHGGRVHASWSPDSTRLVYMQLTPQNPEDDDTRNGCPALPFRAELWIINADGTNPRLLTTTGFSNYDTDGQLINSADDANAPDWSAAGDVITFWSGQEQCLGQVWRINADGSGRTQLTRAPIPSHNDDPAWSPDGSQVLFTTDRNGHPETWVTNADGSNARFLTESAPGPGPGDAAWQPVLSSTANISGRVTTQNGRGVPSARVSLTDNLGNRKYSMTNSFGYYRFLGIPTAQSYTIDVRSKRYIFTSRTINIWGDLTNIDLIAEP